MKRVLAVLTPLVLAVGLAGPASAHEERPASFPDGTGAIPRYQGLDNPRHRVVCKQDSAQRIARMAASDLKRRNQALLKECRFHSIQDAVNSIRKRRTSIYVLPGVYTERKYAGTKQSAYCGNLRTATTAPLLRTSYIGSLATQAIPQADSSARAAADPGPIALSYADQYRCPHNLNLIALLGDRTPTDSSIHCNNQLCGTQIVGTGRTPGAVTIDNKFAKLNAIRADRVSGIYLRNFRVQQAEFNAVYFMETDGFVADRLVARANDEYGILAFASDHGVIKNSHTYFNGDSGIYPGSASDLNGNNTNFAATRYAIEIFGNNSHHNMVGYSGTAGNSVYAHDNDFHHNIGGMSTDSLFPGHPGLPQDHAKWTNNRIYSNNENYYDRYVHKGICDLPMADRGYMRGVVCPVIPVPVGTGIIIAGGNYNLVKGNWIYDNWRQGIQQLWIPAPLRDELDPLKLYDTSNHNHYVNNSMGIAPDGRKLHNGIDFWWDDEGVGNCWDNNTSSRGTPTNNFLLAPASCANGGSIFVPGLVVKDAGFLGCLQYNRADPIFRDPPLCDWFEDPIKPAAAAALGSASSAGPAAGGLWGPGLVIALGAALMVARGRGLRWQR
ncbi:MAG TPA: right-handed parallel beta-helix repeat-containing protein [Nocardioidaceae bacterium]|nr:right-handed parallel beta-helix repeat-containing protein [Nocardioidaceae bacterium]